jgi:hypothetical protein
MVRARALADAAGKDRLERAMLKFVGWTAGIIFLIGLLVVIGVFKLIF